MTMSSVLESALTVSPTPMPTDAMVPLMGLVNCASVSDCWASTRFASAVSMVASSEASVAALSLGEESPEPPDNPDPLPPPVKSEVPVLALDGVVVVVDDPAEAEDPVAPDEDCSAVSAFAKVLSSVATVP
jgi:hypothetical protein